MPFCFSPMRSGSSGNALLVQAGGVRVLVDAGLSARAIEGAMAECAVTPDTIGAILISHEHSDHIRGVSVFSRRFDVPVYATEGTWKAMESSAGMERVALKNRRTFEPGQSFYIRDLAVTPFSIPHDAADPVGFSMMYGAKKLCIATDVGHLAKEWLRELSGADLVLLESNHDPALLRAHPSYPSYLKNRILGKKGHLSNADCGKALVELFNAGLTHAILGHLSAETNRLELAYDTVIGELALAGVRVGEGAQVHMSYRDRSGGVYTIQA